MAQGMPIHSPLGASGASRWIKCPGSVGLSYGIQDTESEHAILGTAAHALAAVCLVDGKDAWELVGCKWDGTGIVESDFPSDGAVPVDKDMADAVQAYLSAVRAAHPERNQGNFWVERQFHCPSIHEYFYGTADAVYLDAAARTLHVWDYKHGAGVVVEVENNVQTMYYAAGALEYLSLWDQVDDVVLHIVQPRGFHFDGPIREWTISTDELADWLDDTLIPAMDRALVSRETKSGDHCRFCPARSRACPQLVADMDELEELMKEFKRKTTAAELTNEQVGRFLDLLDLAKIVAKAAEETAFARLQNGQRIPGRKLGAKRANRIWREDAEKDIVAALGEDAYTEPQLKSPAQVDALPLGKKITARYAYKPDAGLTVVSGDDPRPAVNRDVKALFKPVGKKT